MNSRDLVTRREALKTLGAGAALLGLGAIAPGASGASTPSAAPAAGTVQPFALPRLEFAYDALEPHIDARTMEIHHTKHHQAYIDNANKALLGESRLHTMTAEALLQNLTGLPEAVRTAVRNNVGGHVNHTFFWQVLTPRAGGSPPGRLATALAQSFGSLDAFKTQFAEAAGKRFGSGWAWLVARDGKLAITSTANQDSPLSEGATPLLGLDVWEHAYYLHYQNRRADYVKAFWNVVNWERVAAHHAAAQA